ncbi:MAG: FAD-dependent oxidoreductase [Limnohabitans sp.]
MSDAPDKVWDVLVVGGGATGLGVAVQAALEGRQVALVEARDFACGTSSRSTKLLHGGVRYLAQGRLRLVREALRERATVMQLAPHLAQPLSFVLPAQGWLSWVWMGLGLKAYQCLSGRLGLGATVALSRAALARCLPGIAGAVAGWRYRDGQFEDARLALALAKTARASGASVHNHMKVTAVRRAGPLWRLELEDARTGQSLSVQTRCLVNATGVWVDGLRRMVLQTGGAGGAGGASVPPLVTPSQGVHVVVSRECLPIHEAVLIPKTADGRVLFAVPWLGATVIGTTDTPREDAPLEPMPFKQELDFIFRETRQALGVQLGPSDVRSVWVGLRPLVGHAAGAATSQMSREHLIARDAPGFFTITGGKWTTYRSMAAELMQAMVASADLPAAAGGPGDTAHHRLTGAPAAGQLAHSLHDAPGLHLWGTEAHEVLRLPGAQRDLGMGLTEAMVRFAARSEWALTVEDMLARRWRALFLDAREAARMAPAVAAVLQQETGLDPQLAAFLRLSEQYRLSADD